MGGIFAQTIVFGALRRRDGPRLRPHERRDRPLPLAADRPRRACSAATRVGEPAQARSCRSTLMSITGLIIGWRIHTAVGEALAGYGADGRLLVRDDLGRHPARQHPRRPPRACRASRSSALFPITFIASTFVPVEHAARRRCRRSPSGTRSARSPGRCASCSATPAAPRGRARRGRCSTRSPTPCSGSIAIVVVCAPLAVRAYQRSIRDLERRAARRIGPEAGEAVRAAARAEAARRLARHAGTERRRSARPRTSRRCRTRRRAGPGAAPPATRPTRPRSRDQTPPRRRACGRRAARWVQRPGVAPARPRRPRSRRARRAATPAWAMTSIARGVATSTRRAARRAQRGRVAAGEVDGVQAGRSPSTEAGRRRAAPCAGRAA